ncbi:MAG: hypothetical protein HRU80_13660 [Ignavibacteriales bacterium]|nr:hypothetical protein [Ignavibacteriaceae bacterium]QOJ29859.1 MAG: hypothetical protein HRU80_13660 [Ignavibacteriales bacterium]
MDFFTLIKVTAVGFTALMVFVMTVSWLLSKFRKKKVHYGSNKPLKKPGSKTRAQATPYSNSPAPASPSPAPAARQPQPAMQVKVPDHMLVQRPVMQIYNQQAQMAKQRTIETVYNVRSYIPMNPPRERFQIINAQQPELRKMQIDDARAGQRPSYVPRPVRPQQGISPSGSGLLKNYASGKDRLNKLNFALV